MLNSKSSLKRKQAEADLFSDRSVMILIHATRGQIETHVQKEMLNSCNQVYS